MSRMNVHEIGGDWVLNEFRNFDIEDERLRGRFFLTAQLLASKPLDCIYKACGSWSAVKGAYRLFSNKKLSTEDIFSCHQAETVRRISEHKRVFVIQDTCFLDYGTHTKTKGLGSISKNFGENYKKGLIIHPSYVVTESALPLGILTWKSWSRPKPPKRTPYENLMNNYHRETKEKESNKWLEALREEHDLVRGSVQVVTLADREADIYELMQEHIKHGRSFVIRNRINRRLERKTYRQPKLHEVLRERKAAGKIVIDIPARQGRKARQVKAEIRFGAFSTPLRSNIKGGVSKNRQGLPAKISFNVVHVVETKPPAGEEALEWFLLTNEEVGTVDQAIEKVSWYKLRWQVETFFRTLKSGCRIESSLLREAERLDKYNALMATIAWRICFMTHSARQDSKAPCTAVLDEDRWKALYCRIKRTARTPRRPPTTGEAVLWLAQLGGFLNRKGDGPPGPMVLWRGWQALEEMLPLYLAMTSSKPP